MSKEEDQLGVPPVNVMRQLLNENRSLVRLLSTDPNNEYVDATQAEPCPDTDAADALVSAYREVLELLEIVSATSAPRSREETSGR